MKTIVVATKNKNKMVEFQAILGGISNLKLVSLADIGFDQDIDETGDTCKENAKIKADAVMEFLKQHGEAQNFAVMSDDSGLFIKALGGAPGVHSARFAGDHSSESNRQKVLSLLSTETDRSAYYECVICYENAGQVEFFEGKTYGTIATEKRGSEKFDYDCLFISDDLGKTFGEASEEEKDAISHRGRAVAKLREYLEQINAKQK